MCQKITNIDSVASCFLLIFMVRVRVRESYRVRV